MSRISRSEWFFITALLLFAAGLRFVGITFGQPTPEYARSTYPKQMFHEQTPLHPDEYFNVTIPIEMLVKNDLNPHFFEYPSFLINLNFVTFWLTGAENGISRDNWQGQSSRTFAPFHLYVMVRAFAGLGGILTVAATYAIARRMAGRFAAAAAGMLVAVSFTMVQHAHYATQSSISVGLAMLSIWAAFACLHDHRPKWWLFALSGIAAGFATGCRYNVAAVTIVLFLVGCVLLYRYRSRRMLRLVIASWLAAPAAFLFSTPYAILDFPAFIDGFRYLTGQYLSTGTNINDFYLTEPFTGLLVNYQFLVTFALGIPASLAAVLGIWVCWKSRPAWKHFLRANISALFAAILLVYILAYSLVVLRNVRPYHGDHLLMLVIPCYTIFAGIGAGWLYDRLPIPKRILSPALLLMLVIVPLSLTVPLVYTFSQRDTRQIMQEWVYKHLPMGAKIHLSGPYNVPLDKADYPSTQILMNGVSSFEELQVLDADYLIYSDAFFFDVSRHDNPASQDDLRSLLDFKLLLDSSFTRIAWIERPPLLGYDWPMNGAAYWHNPSLTVYCLNARACQAVG
jgi:hypothetical protein